MSLVSRTIHAFESAPLPDAVRRGAISLLVTRASRQLERAPLDAGAFAQWMSGRPIAEHVDAANAQHYEVPPDFFVACLGPRLKYSCCLYENGEKSLAAAEESALAATCGHAALCDGQRILELGCGWGSLTLWMAQHYPNARITAVSNSNAQGAHILAAAKERGLSNIQVITADANVFQPTSTFDRIVSVEMFEHMSNWRALLARCRQWLEPDGRVFLHVFAHRASPYRFDVADNSDWIAQHFFTGGVMPSRNLIRGFADIFEVEREWWWCGQNYERTALDWLANYDARIADLRPILRRAYGADARLWENRWRLFFLVTASLFGHDEGRAWGVVHHLLKPAARK